MMPSEGQGLELLQNEAIPLLDHKKKPLRRIHPIEPASEENPLHRFGPLYRDNQSSKENDEKERAWKHVLEKSPDTEAITTEIYLSAMRRIEGKAREAYGEGTTMDKLTGSQFRWMMIKDGCFFLQMVLFILGRSDPSDDEFFGAKRNSKDMKEWIKSMFFVGNQIPFVVLKELMKQSFFKQVISEGKWNKLPSELSKSVLYEFLVLPALETNRGRTCTKGPVHWMNEQPIDLIHALQLLVLGPQNDDKTEEEGAESEDDEAEDHVNESTSITQQIQLVIKVEGPSDDKRSPSATESKGESVNQKIVINLDDASYDKSCPSATELKQQGMNFEVCFNPMKACIYYMKLPIKACRYRKIVKGIGSRGITYVSGFSAALFLPQLMVDDETELLLGCLQKYELTQPLDQKNRDFSSYLRFMSELIGTPEDANLLNSRGIIHGSNRYKQKLPRILDKLATKEKYNHKFRALTRKISDYNRPKWKNFQCYVFLITFLTVVQTVYAVIAFHVGK